MRPREWALSALFVVILALPVAEAIMRIERWPLTTVAMFSQRISPSTPVRYVTLVGTTAGGVVREMTARDFGLTSNELYRRIPPDIRWLGRSCGELGQAYNARRRRSEQRLAAMRADVTIVARPGAKPPAIPRWSVDCPLGAE
jgi:hypothetical protein